VLNTVHIKTEENLASLINIAHKIMHPIAYRPVQLKIYVLTAVETKMLLDGCCDITWCKVTSSG